jgi:uncharacterized protein (TIGR02646 family)
MIRIKKSIRAPRSLEKSYNDMTTRIKKIIQDGNDVILCQKGSKKPERLPPKVVVVEIDDDQYKPPEAKARLKREQFGKCAFCEARFMDTAGGDVEHFRPKKRHDGYVPMTAHLTNLGYFQLMYQWENLLWSCKECNESFKKNYFDMMPDMTTPPPSAQDFKDLVDFCAALSEWGKYEAPKHQSWNDKSVEEKPVLINPLLEDPRQHINFDSESGMAVGGKLDDDNQLIHLSDRGGKNILVLGLNRPELVFSRSRHLALLRGVFVAMQGNYKQAVDFLTWQRPAGWEQVKGTTLRHEIKHYKKFPVANNPSISCLQFLVYSTTPQAPFSAMAMDALAVWSKELAIHLMKPRTHATQLQQPNIQSWQQTYSTNDLLPLNMHSVILNTYKKDEAAIFALKKSAYPYRPLWEAGYKNNEIEFVCRTRLHHVIANHENFRVKHLHYSSPFYQADWLAHFAEISEVEEALQLYGIDGNTWNGAVTTMDKNMASCSPDLSSGLVEEGNIAIENCLACVNKFVPNNILQDSEWVNVATNTVRLAERLTATLEARIKLTSDELIIQTADELMGNLGTIIKAFQLMKERTKPSSLPEVIDQDAPLPWEAPTAVRVKTIPHNYAAAWDMIRLRLAHLKAILTPQ